MTPCTVVARAHPLWNRSCAVIPLGAASPRTLISDLPGGFGNGSSRRGRTGQVRNASLALGSRFPPYLVLLRVGFTLPPALQPERCALTAPFHPYRTHRPGNRPWARPLALSLDTPGWRYVFCGTGRLCALKRTSRTLSGTLPCGVRTFLPRQPRSRTATGSDRPVLLPVVV
jgi:hypothetical protein